MSKRDCCNCNVNMLCCGYNSSNKVTAEGEIYHCVNDRLCATIESSDITCRYTQGASIIQNPLLPGLNAVYVPDGVGEGDKLINWEYIDVYGGGIVILGALRIQDITSREYKIEINNPEHSETTRFIFCPVTSDTRQVNRFSLTGFPVTYSDYGFGKEISDDVIIDKDFFSTLRPVRIKTTLNDRVLVNSTIYGNTSFYNKTITFEDYDFGFNLIISGDGMTAMLDRYMNCYDNDRLRKPVLGPPSIYSILNVTDDTLEQFTFDIKSSYFSRYEHNDILPLRRARDTSSFLTTRVIDNDKENCMKPGIIDTWVDSRINEDNEPEPLNGWGISSSIPNELMSVNVFCPYNSTNCRNYLSFYNLQEKKTCMDMVLMANTDTGGFLPVDLHTIISSSHLTNSHKVINPSTYIDRDYTDEVDLRGTLLLSRIPGPYDIFGNPTLIPIEVESYPLLISDSYTDPIETTNMSVLDESRTKFIEEINPHTANCSCQGLNSQREIPRFLDTSFNKIITNKAVNDIPPTSIVSIEVFRAFNYSLVLDGVADNDSIVCPPGYNNSLLMPNACTGVLIDGAYYDKVYYLSFIADNGVEFSVNFEKAIHSGGTWTSTSICVISGTPGLGVPTGGLTPSDPADNVPCFDVANYRHLCNITMSITNNQLTFIWSSVHGGDTIVSDDITCRELALGWSLNGYFPYAEYGVMISGRFVITPKYLRYQ